MPSIWLSSSSRDTRFSMRPAPHFLVILFWSYSTIVAGSAEPVPTGAGHKRKRQGQAAHHMRRGWCP